MPCGKGTKDITSPAHGLALVENTIDSETGSCTRRSPSGCRPYLCMLVASASRMADIDLPGYATTESRLFRC